MEIKKRVMLCHHCGKPLKTKDHYPFCSDICERLESNFTKCWLCENACGRCSWSSDGKPVEGWTAKKTRIVSYRGEYAESYRVIDCPDFNLIPCRTMTKIVKGQDTLYIPLGAIHDKSDRRPLAQKYGTAVVEAYEESFSGVIGHSKVQLCITVMLPALGSGFNVDRLCRAIVIALRGVAYPEDCEVTYRKFAMNAKEFGVSVKIKEVSDAKTE